MGTTSPPRIQSALAGRGSRHPLWDEPQPFRSRRQAPTARRALGVEGAPTRRCRSPRDSTLPQDTLDPAADLSPVVVAVGIAIFFVGLLVEAAIVGVVGIIIGGIAIMRWTWRTEEDLR